MPNVDYTGLFAWQSAMDLAETVYSASGALPRREIFGLAAQMRRAAVSIPSNIAEGQGRRTDGEFLNQLSVAHGSTRELETQFLLAERLGLLEKAPCRSVLEKAAQVGRLINGLANSIDERRKERGR